MTTALPASYSWIRYVLTLLTAVLSTWSLVAKNERNAIDCSDLHFRWNKLAVEYESLWSNVYRDDAEKRLDELKSREMEISKSSTVMPEDEKLLIHWRSM